jgi:hypothetical protein
MQCAVEDSLGILVFYLILTLEPFHSTRGVYDLLLAGEERMAFTAKFHSERLLGRTGGKGVAARAYHSGVVVIFRMYLGFHFVFSL